MEWKCGSTSGQIVAGNNEKGNEMNQLDYPTDVIVGKETNTLIICDAGNRRVVEWCRGNGTSGQTIISDIDCNTLTMDNNGYIYVSDFTRHEVRRWKMDNNCGTLVAGGKGEGGDNNQLNCPTYTFVDEDHSVYVSDRDNHRVMKWMKDANEGIVVAGGHDEGNSLTQLSSPWGIIVDHLGSIYVADGRNHRIMRWDKGTTQGNIVVGGNEKGDQANQLYFPEGLSFDQEGNLYVADYANHRVQKFNIDQS